MSAPKCPICSQEMKRHGRTSAGKQRWRCRGCNSTKTHKINSDAKQLDEFLSWLLGKQRQLDMPGEGRWFRKRTAKFWSIWPLPPLVDEIHRVVYVDGIHLGRSAVVLVACSDEYVLGWYLARQENSRAWEALLSRIAPPDMVVTDGGTGFARACRKVWPQTEIQRCVFHAFNRVKRCTTAKPRLQAGAEPCKLALELLRIETTEEAAGWLRRYFEWSRRWDSFLAEEAVVDGRRQLTHERLVKARSSLNRLISTNHLFTYLDERLTLGGPRPKTNNRIGAA